MKNRLWSDTDKDRLCELYQDINVPVQDIATEMGRTVQSVRMLAARLDLSRFPELKRNRRTMTCQQCGKKTRVFISNTSQQFCSPKCLGDHNRKTDDDTMFSRRDPETAYWAGFMMADGCVSRSKKGVESISLSLIDIEHVVSFAKFITCDQAPTPVPTGFRIGVSSHQMADDLAQWGVIPNKTHFGVVPEDIPKELQPHYIRGLIDGDGGIYIRREKRRLNSVYWRLQLTNNQPVIEWTARTIEKHIGVRSSIRQTDLNDKTNHATFNLEIYCKRDVQKVLKWLKYAGDVVSLDRKRHTALSIIEADL